MAHDGLTRVRLRVRLRVRVSGGATNLLLLALLIDLVLLGHLG